MGGSYEKHTQKHNLKTHPKSIQKDTKIESRNFEHLSINGVYTVER